MLASVPLVSIAAPRIFLPESEYERDLRIFCEYVRKMQDLLFAELCASARIPWSDEGWPLFKEAYKLSVEEPGGKIRGVRGSPIAILTYYDSSLIGRRP